MLVEKPRVRAMVTDAVAEIESKGVKATVDDILWLAHLADNHARNDSGEVLNIPVKCGRAKLYQRTLAGDLWMEDYASKWWPEPRHPVMNALCELYSLAHGSDSKAIEAVCTRTSARIRVRLWAMLNLPVSGKQIKVALDRLSARIDHVDVQDEEILKQSEVQPADYGEIVSTLCAAYKMPPRTFLFDMSVNEVQGMYRRLAIAMGRPDLMDRQSDGDDSFGKFRLAVREIIRRGNNVE